MAPAEYTLDKRVAEISGGSFRYPDKIFPDLPIKNPYNYPGMQAGLKAKDTVIVNIVSDNLPPKADAGLNRNVRPNEEVMLDGLNSRDADHEILACSVHPGVGVFANSRRSQRR